MGFSPKIPSVSPLAKLVLLKSRQKLWKIYLKELIFAWKFVKMSYLIASFQGFYLIFFGIFQISNGSKISRAAIFQSANQWLLWKWKIWFKLLLHVLIILLHTISLKLDFYVQVPHAKPFTHGKASCSKKLFHNYNRCNAIYICLCLSTALQKNEKIKSTGIDS